ncbi:MAG: hypothetical protein WCK34_17020 [Bacteroidota bacterium]
MSAIIRFKPVEIDSKVYFIGRKKKILKYPVRSVSLVALPIKPDGEKQQLSLPEIFW